MIGMGDRSFFRLRVTGIDKSASREEPYGVHLHQGTCDADNPSLAGIHYNVAWHPLDTLIPLEKVNNKNEVWLDLDVDSDGRRTVNRDSGVHSGEGPSVNRAPRYAYPLQRNRCRYRWGPARLPAIHDQEDQLERSNAIQSAECDS